MMPLINHNEPLSTPIELDTAARNRIEHVLNGIHIDSETQFRFGDLDPIDITQTNGTSHSSLSSDVVNEVPASSSSKWSSGGKENRLANAISPLVYHFCYARVFDDTSSPRKDTENSLKQSPAVQSGSPNGEYSNELWSSHKSRQRWDGGWNVYKVESSGSVHVEKDSVFRLVPPGQYSFPGGINRSPNVGESVDLFVSSGSTNLQPGFHFFFGETIPSDFDDALLARFYFHCGPETAPWLIETIGIDLNRYRVPFRIKCLNNPELYTRTDPFVLYVAKRFLPIVMRVLYAHRKSLSEKLRKGTPLFTKELMNGLGACDEPGNGMSFGQHRSILLAKGLVDAWRNKTRDLQGRLDAIHKRFEVNNLSLHRPYLNERTADLYEWPDERRNQC